jgi:predicted transposase YbfD/YdcC
VDAKSNEIPAVRDLLKAFASLAGAVITIDALRTQSDTAQVITSRQADYVMTVKGNMPTLYQRLEKLPWTAVPAFSAVSMDHGRRARRTIKSRSSTSLPATATPVPPPWRPGCGATGR